MLWKNWGVLQLTVRAEFVDYLLRSWNEYYPEHGTIKGGECWLLARNRQTLYGAGNLTKEPGYESKGNKYHG